MPLSEITPFALADLEEIGSGLNRPECVLADRDGSLFTGDWSLGIARISADGTTAPAVGVDLVERGFRPNGIALTSDGDFLITNMARAGGVWRVSRAGDVSPFVTEIAGQPLPPTNFVLVDGERAWITISSTTRGHDHFTAEAHAGQILLMSEGKVSVAADGLNWTNELRVSPDGEHLFVNETFACRTTRFNVAPDGSLINPVQIAFPEDTYPDGMAFDSEGGLWITCVISNRLIRLAPDLSWTTLLEDPDPALPEIAASYDRGCLSWNDVSRSRGVRLANLSSIAFGGPDLGTIYLGGLGHHSVYALQSPVAGAPMNHWAQATSPLPSR